jgi:hypothetical protein
MAGPRDFSLLHRVQTESGAHPASYRMGIGDFSPGGRSVLEADHSPPSSAEVKNGGTIPLLPDTSSRRICMCLMHEETKTSKYKN